MSDDEFEIQEGSQTFRTKADSLNVGDYMMIEEHPCLIVSKYVRPMSHYKSLLNRFTGKDIFTDHEYCEPYFSHSKVTGLVVLKKDYELIAIAHDDFVTFTDEEGNMRDDLKLPDAKRNDWVKTLKEIYEKGGNIFITVRSAVGQETIVGFN